MTTPKAPFADCETCPLQLNRHVLGKGPDNPKLIVVGEAPGGAELSSGIPFTGKAGQLLNRVLKYHGIERDEIYFTNTVLCRPIKKSPTKNEIDHCYKRLVEEIKSKKSPMVLTLGAVASKAVLDTTEGIKSLRLGGPQYSELLETYVIPTFNPAAALRNPDLFPSILEDTKKITRDIEVVWEPTQYEVEEDTGTAVSTLVDQLEHARDSLLSVDIETQPPFNRFKPDFLCIGISHTPGHSVVYSKEVVDNRAFQYSFATALADRNYRWLYQLGKFDTQHLWSFAPKAEVSEDTLLMHYATDERKGIHSLEQIATSVLDAPKWKTEAKSGLEDDEDLSHLPKEVLYWYNAQDTDITYRLYDPLMKEMEQDGVVEVYRNLLIPASNALARVEYGGFTVDEPYLTTLHDEYTEKTERLEIDLHKWVANPRSPQQVKRALLELGYDVSSTQAVTLAEIDEDFTRTLLKYRKNHKLLSTYIDGMAEHIKNGKIHSTFNVQGTETGRLSSSKPNLQNIPVGSTIRNLFTADNPDRVILNVDYSGIELRIAAILSKDPWLSKVFQEGRKLHQEVAEELYGKDYTPAQYKGTKNTNFSVLYEAGAAKVASLSGVSYKDADRMIQAWEKRSPAFFVDWRKEIQQGIMDNGYLRSHFGRLRRFWLVTPENRGDIFREGYNFPIQSMASDLTLESIILLDKKFRNSDVRIVSTVHDSTMFDVPKDIVEDVTREIIAVMEDKPYDIPILAEATHAYRWGEL